ncbi:hypothetical protein GH714_023670 [Hevea brasiliensis]|uniref:UspA domain-containing protein n=1 Tax=Hevea brasiliensis TaxID=3981 RepID=A0A6A6KVD4_HEVBR|nr:hypothetical protein GH714_023670 [Hevea brasiliensis]
MVVVDHNSHSKHAMMWALTHAANNGDLLTLLHIIPPVHKGSERASGSDSFSPYLTNSLGSLCKACKPQSVLGSIDQETESYHSPQMDPDPSSALH